MKKSKIITFKELPGLSAELLDTVAFPCYTIYKGRRVIAEFWDVLDGEADEGMLTIFRDTFNEYPEVISGKHLHSIRQAMRLVYLKKQLPIPKSAQNSAKAL